MKKLLGSWFWVCCGAILSALNEMDAKNCLKKKDLKDHKKGMDSSIIKMEQIQNSFNA